MHLLHLPYTTPTILHSPQMLHYLTLLYTLLHSATHYLLIHHTLSQAHSSGGV